MTFFMQQIISFIIGGTITAAGVIAYMHLMRIRKEKGVYAHMSAAVRLNELAQELVRTANGVEHCLVLCLSNGGNKPRVGGTFFATALVNQVSEQHDNKHRSYEKILVDTDYIQRLVNACAIGVQVMHVGAMSDGLLRTLYEQEGVRYAELYYLHATDDAFFYCTFATYSAEHLQGARGDIAVTVNAFREVLKKVFGR